MNLHDFFTITNWWGKILGACFGYLCAGPLGSLFGILIGNFFDKGLVNHFTDPYLSYHAVGNKAAQQLFIDTTFSVMGYIAKSDGRVSQQEIELAKQLMHEIRLSYPQKKRAEQVFNAGKSPTFKLNPVLLQFLNAFRDNAELLRLFADIQYKVAQVDGLSAKKILLLDTIFSALGFAPLNQQYRFYEDFSYTAYQNHQHYQNHQQQNQYYQPRSSSNNLEHAYALLAVTASSNQQEVKKAYRRLVSKNHPDKLAAQGLSEAQIKTANEKTQKIMRAYELICKSKGW